MQNSKSDISSQLVKTTSFVQKTKWLKFLKAVPFHKVIFQEVFLAGFLFFPIRKCIAEIKARKFSSLDDLIDFSFTQSGGLLNPAQIREEIKSLLSILEKNEVRSFMEIGTAQGGTLFLFFKVSAKDAEGISLDLPGGTFGGGYPKFKIPLYKSFPSDGQKLTLVRGDSHSSESLGKISGILGGKKLDFLFIDGDHTYEGVKKDFEMYSQFVRKGGIVAFHDIAIHPKEGGCEVDRYWNEIKKSYKNEEFIKDRNQGTCGIGVLYL